ncbi:ankyrin repeat protein [Mollivirus sibericum]|uniref:ankyrin repeat protein n=1 Tax=Mollivirus sibericum TaxID=1678078 RepID=UPI0006B2E6B5|nr:ankyrin repeat protein [Mollivirus sibericum]ALD62243.1 ankyrin repeat protein [Mollivirus sibericum]
MTMHPINGVTPQANVPTMASSSRDGVGYTSFEGEFDNVEDELLSRGPFRRALKTYRSVLGKACDSSKDEEACYLVDGTLEPSTARDPLFGIERFLCSHALFLVVTIIAALFVFMVCLAMDVKYNKWKLLNLRPGVIVGGCHGCAARSS